MSKIITEDMSYITRKFEKAQLFQGKTVLITGAAGFLGYYFSNWFASLMKKDMGPSRLILLDTYLIGKPQWVTDFELSKELNIECLCFDITKDSLDSIAGAFSADYVIHMASIASPVYYRKYPVETFNANVLGLSKLFEFYKNASNLKGLLFFSSSEIYGDPDTEHIPTDEEYKGNVSCVGPRACYDEGKRAGEAMCYIYNQQFDIPVRVARPFNNYGCGMSINDKRVPADFAKAVINNCDIIMHSDGTPKRTFCYIADAIVGYLKVLTYSEYNYFNIGMDKPEISIKELAEIYVAAGKDLFSYTGKVVFEKAKEKDYLTNNPQRRCPDIEKARRLLNYNPEITVEEGVRRYLQWAKELS